ncbi:MAG TPA: HlyD family efflux transporter periplasmic adaptor subunit [Polyangiales bacterium]|nr:HlyD family efflux transporter periplasmic adaptor subunit [Polyangiales bacterium]
MNSLFREQALEFHRRGGLRGDVLHITPALLRAVYWLVFALAALGLSFLCTAEVSNYATGPAVVMLEQRHEVTATRAGVVSEILVHVGQQVHSGDVLVRLGAPSESAELRSVERELDDQLVLLMRNPEDRGARQELLALRSRRELAETAIERSVLRATRDGKIADLRVRAGQLIEAGTPLLALQAEPHGAEITALLPGPDRPRLKPGMPLSLRVDGFERTHLQLQIDRVDEQVLGPREALRVVGTELAGSFEVQGPIVLVHARLASPELNAQGTNYRLHHGMLARAEVAVDREPLLFAWLPGLREALSDVF